MNSEDFKKQVDDLFKNEKALIYDAAMLQTIEEAKQGNPLAWLNIYESFLWGDNPKRRYSKPVFKAANNLNIAKYFCRLVIDYLKSNLGYIEKQSFCTFEQANTDVKDLVVELVDLGLIEEFLSNFDEAKKIYCEAINLMTKTLEPERWDFRVFDFLQELIKLQEENQANR
ncbi:hypothetical protein [Runella limosa]|uniref:hypothetical protein n=1 Tax=Runella limosa TaxID=370978 RepID=UPI0004035B21|nr:hypothetical protein [Runella limosa]